MTTAGPGGDAQVMRCDAEGLRRQLVAALGSVAGEDAPLEARMIVEAVTGLDRTALRLHGAVAVQTAQLAAAQTMLARRLAREPLSQILGSRGFWTLDIDVTADVLTPRPDTETLIEAMLDFVDADGRGRGYPWRVLDLGTGSGCLPAALLSELPEARAIAIDRSPAAARVARRNLDRIAPGRALVVVSDWASCLAATGCETGAFDLILSNPPYIPSGEIRTLDPEVARHEPHLALDGGDDGLTAYRVLAPAIARLLRPDGFASIEIGLGQALDVERLLADRGLTTSVRNDLGHIARCVTARHAVSRAA